MTAMSWTACGPRLWIATVDYARVAAIDLVRGVGYRAAVVLRKAPEKTEGELGVFDSVEAARDALERRLRPCFFCGSRWRCCGGREPSALLRDLRVVDDRVVYSPECEALERARQATAPLILDATWRFAPLDPRTTPTGWRVIEPWWAVGPAGHVLLELDASARGGPGWWLIRRGSGAAGPMKTWQEAMRA